MPQPSRRCKDTLGLCPKTHQKPEVSGLPVFRQLRCRISFASPKPRVQGRNPGRFKRGYGVPRGFKGGSKPSAPCGRFSEAEHPKRKKATLLRPLSAVSRNRPGNSHSRASAPCDFRFPPCFFPHSGRMPSGARSQLNATFLIEIRCRLRPIFGFTRCSLSALIRISTICWPVPRATGIGIQNFTT